jgi:hypothetical protein
MICAAALVFCGLRPCPSGGALASEPVFDQSAHFVRDIGHLAALNLAHRYGAAEETDSANADAELKEWSAIEKRLLEQWDKLDSFSAKLVTHLELATPEGTRMVKGEGFYDLQKSDGKLLVLTHTVSETRMTTTSGEQKSTESILAVSDGTNVQSWFKRGDGVPRLIKESAEASIQIMIPGGPKLFETIRQAGEIKVLPQAMMDGKRVFVIETTPRSGGKPTVHHFDERTGLMIKMEQQDEASKSRRSIELRDLVMNPQCPSGHFNPQEQAAKADRGLGAVPIGKP